MRLLVLTAALLALCSPASADRLGWVSETPWPEECKEHFPTIVETWYDAGLDPYVGLAVAFRESRCDPRATSGKGACGLFQVIPYDDRATCGELKNPGTAARWGAKILLDYGVRQDRRKALAGYVCGMGNWGACKPNADLRISDARRFREQAEEAKEEYRDSQ